MWRRIQKFLATFIPSILLLLYFAVGVCWLNRWDSVVALTLIPLWAWSGFAMAVSLLTWIVCRGPASLVVFTIWMVTMLLFSEESHSLSRELIHSVEPKAVPEEREMLRVVNVNANRSTDVLRGVGHLKPDIVLVQRIPDEAEVAEVTKEFFGKSAASIVDGNLAIMARGEFLTTLAEEGAVALHARLRLEGGFVIDLSNVQLHPCVPRVALWDPETWTELTEARILNRRLLRGHLGENQITRATTARLMGGGFLTPPGDDVFRPLEGNGMVDAFKKAGEGWGNTYPSEYPLLRLDQIWVSENLEPFRTTTEANPESAHRTVVSDLLLPAGSR